MLLQPTIGNLYSIACKDKIMNLIKPALCTLTMIFSASVLANITLEIPDTINLLAVNGQKPETSGSLFSSAKSLELADGEQQIVFKYAPYFTQGNDRVIIESDAVIATFTAKDAKLNFAMPEYRDAHRAEKEIKTMQWSLIDQAGQSLEIKQDRLLKEGYQVGRDYIREANDYNRAGGIAAIGMTDVAMLQNELAQSGNVQNAAEEMLHFWYNKADEKTQARFKEFVNQQ
ncbi:hypothetical protein B9J93_16375 [Vibrio sp. V17_P4S1T151]|nr:hypothetical protein CEJ46_14855 [Vibrio anguillarum]NAX45224.1 DUF2057 domain-containing protein [Vibrio sp. V25_P4S6T154]OXX43113.1 hypothetical protein B9J93_16375 [Vibrio sp. V17_P4S1T151]OXX62993.1 hypothetical protein B9J89_09775 [Vibrio sp. V15_P4S5T153]OXX68685.1 hypothetical protein B9J94_07555 [Vibrio sp. V20_P4S3T152]